MKKLKSLQGEKEIWIPSFDIFLWHNPIFYFDFCHEFQRNLGFYSWFLLTLQIILLFNANLKQLHWKGIFVGIEPLLSCIWIRTYIFYISANVYDGICKCKTFILTIFYMTMKTNVKECNLIFKKWDKTSQNMQTLIFITWKNSLNAFLMYNVIIESAHLQSAYLVNLHTSYHHPT
jgi:hypothetical protein